MFVGRESELRTLENLYEKNVFQMLVIYGRRRVGKTTLLAKFIENKPAIFFSAQEANDKMNLALFSKAIFDFFQVSSAFPPFDTWHDAFGFIAEKAKTERFVLAIDEFPYAAEENRSLKSILQNIIDHKLKETKIFLILCGSQIGFMESEVLGYKSPLFGRRTSQMSLEGFPYSDAAKMLNGFSLDDKIKLYACIGGTPHYLARIDNTESFENNLAALYFHKSGYLYDEPSMLLKQELRSPAMYNSIIVSIAGGASRLNEISTKVGAERSKTIKYLETLIGLKILHKEYPFGDDPAKSRKGIYKISDNCYRFWYRYVFQERTAIEQGAGKAVLHSILPEINSFMGKSFEDVCFQYMINQNNDGRLPFVFTRSGRWWGANPQTKQQEEIDLIFSSSDNKKAVFAECKWTNAPVGPDVLGDLERRSSLFDSNLFNGAKKWFYLFAKAGFSDRLVREAAKRENVRLVRLKDMF